MASPTTNVVYPVQVSKGNTLYIESYMDMTTYIQNEISLEKYLKKRDNIIIQVRNEYKKDKNVCEIFIAKHI